MKMMNDEDDEDEDDEDEDDAGDDGTFSAHQQHRIFKGVLRRLEQLYGSFVQRGLAKGIEDSRQCRNCLTAEGLGLGCARQFKVHLRMPPRICTCIHAWRQCRALR